MEYLRDVSPFPFFPATLRSSFVVLIYVYYSSSTESYRFAHTRRSSLERLSQVFWNIMGVIAVNTRFRDALNMRQKSQAIGESVVDVLMELVPNYESFLSSLIMCRQLHHLQWMKPNMTSPTSSTIPPPISALPYAQTFLRIQR